MFHQAKAFGQASGEQASKKWRRSIFVVADTKKGEPFVKGKNVRSIRPAAGLHTRHWPIVLGSVASRDVARGEPLDWTMLAVTDGKKRKRGDE